MPLMNYANLSSQCNHAYPWAKQRIHDVWQNAKMSTAFCYVQESCTKCVWFHSRKVYVIDLSREATGKLIEKAGTRRLFRLTFQSRPGIINPPITCYYFCFDLVVKSLFFAMINMVYCEYSLPLQMERTTRNNTKMQIFPHPFLKQGTNPKGVPFWRNKGSEKGTSEHILSQFRTALLSPSLFLNIVQSVQSDG